MYNSLTRLQNVFGYFTTVAAAVAIAIAALSLITTPVPAIKEGGLKLNNLQVTKGRPHYFSEKKDEFAHIKFDLDIDLSSLFTWNTKQIFLYITTTYPSRTPGIAPTEAILWDAILPHPLAPKHSNTYSYPSANARKLTMRERKLRQPSIPDQPPAVSGLLKLAGQRPKYQITDASGSIASRPNATLELSWNVQPWVGALQWASAPRRSVSPGVGKVSAPGWLSFLTWRTIRSKGARTAEYDFPGLKDRAEAAKAAGARGLDTERGGEGNRGRPS